MATRKHLPWAEALTVVRRLVPLGVIYGQFLDVTGANDQIQMATRDTAARSEALLREASEFAGAQRWDLDDSSFEDRARVVARQVQLSLAMFSHSEFWQCRHALADAKSGAILHPLIGWVDKGMIMCGECEGAAPRPISGMPMFPDECDVCGRVPADGMFRTCATQSGTMLYIFSSCNDCDAQLQPPANPRSS